MKKNTKKTIKVNSIRRRLHTKKTRKKSSTKKGKSRPRWWDKTIDAPESLDILDNESRNKTLTFIEKIHKALNDKFHHIRLDFEDTEAMYGPATLLLRAELHRIRERYPKRSVKCSYAKNQSVNLALSQLNVLSACGQSSRGTPNEDQTELFRSWRSESGKGSDGQKCDPILDEYELYLHGTLSQELYDGLTEAMTNTRHHAYPNRRSEEAEYTEWWIFSQELSDHLLINICDLGIGIPKSLPSQRPQLWKKLLLLSEAPLDSEIIQCTIDNKISSTGEDYRGKGLTQLASVADSLPQTGFMIFSGKGLYAKKNNEVTVKDYEQPINGTIAVWRLPKNERTDHEV